MHVHCNTTILTVIVLYMNGPCLLRRNVQRKNNSIHFLDKCSLTVMPVQSYDYQT